MITPEFNSNLIQYLPLNGMVQMLTEIGDIPPEKIPTPVKLQYLMSRISAKIENFLGFNPLPTVYIESTQTNEDGFITLTKYPVLNVLEIKQLYGSMPPSPFQILNTSSIWGKDTRLYIGARNATVEVRYEAGFRPMPDEFVDAMFRILRDSISEYGGNLDFLSTPTRDISSLSVPGGLSQSFQLGKSSDEAGGTQLDRYLNELAKYKRLYKF
jgi:hypothetical protein